MISNSDPDSLSMQEAQGILYQYRAVLEGMIQRRDHAINVSHLPISKERIKKALLVALQDAQGDAARTTLFRTAYRNLSRFQPGIRDGETSIALVLDRGTSDSPDNFDSLANYSRQMEMITVEEAELEAELKKEGY